MSLRPVPRWASSTTPGGACSSCGNTRIDADGFCENCGHRKAAGLDRVELELDGVVAITDRGPRRRRNEDAVGIGQVGDYLAIIVCDGVASTARADVAAHAAVDAGIVAILRALAEGESADCAVRASFGAALAAVALLGESSGDTAPSCTFVSAVVAAGDSAESGGIGGIGGGGVGEGEHCHPVLGRRQPRLLVAPWGRGPGVPYCGRFPGWPVGRGRHRGGGGTRLAGGGAGSMAGSRCRGRRAPRD